MEVEDSTMAKDPSNLAQNTHQSDVPVTNTNPNKPSCCQSAKRVFLYSLERQEIQAFYLVQFGTGTLFISFMFLSLAILQLANEQAGCPQTESGGYEDCGNKVYGMQPSSMLAMMAMVGGIATSLFMPYAGAVVDFSDHRLRFGKMVASIFVLVNFVQIFLFPSTWFAMAVLQAVFATASLYGLAMMKWSYMSAPSDYDLHGITASGRVWETGGMIGTFIVVGVVQFTSGWDSVNVARFGQAYASLVGGIPLFIAFQKKYKPVKAVHPLEPGKNLYVAGLQEIWHTLFDLGKTEPAAQRYLFAYMFNAAAMTAFSTMSVTYFSEQIHMSSTEIAAFSLLTLAINPLGSMVHRPISRRFGIKKSYIGVLVYFVGITAFYIGAIAGPEQKNLVWLIAVLYGIGMGWYYPSSNGYYVLLVPEERVAELWGFNMFMAAVLSWVPPLVFAALNESTGSLRYALLSLLGFIVIGLVIAITIPEKKNDGRETNFGNEGKKDGEVLGVGSDGLKAVGV